MTRFLSILALVLSAPIASGQGATLIGIKCNPKTDRLAIYYVNSDESRGSPKIRNEWSLSDLYSMKDEDHIGEMKTVSRTCQLTHGKYLVEIGPAPGNLNVQGRCGGVLSAWVRIRRNMVPIYIRQSFEPGCDEVGGKVLTRVTIGPGDIAPKLIEIDSDDFFRQ